MALEPDGQLNGAIQEYHYLANRGVPLGPWENAICHQDAWIVSDENGKPYLEQQLDKTSNMFTPRCSLRAIGSGATTRWR